MKAILLAASLVCLSGLACPTPPPQPVPPDVGALGGSPGTGGAPSLGGSPNSGGTPGIGGAVPVTCSNTCCRSCQVLREHGCIEGTPTEGGITCEARNYCDGSKKLPATLALSDLTACTSLDCIRHPPQKKRGVACEAGR